MESSCGRWPACRSRGRELHRFAARVGDWHARTCGRCVSDEQRWSHVDHAVGAAVDGSALGHHRLEAAALGVGVHQRDSAMSASWETRHAVPPKPVDRKIPDSGFHTGAGRAGSACGGFPFWPAYPLERDARKDSADTGPSVARLSGGRCEVQVRIDILAHAISLDGAAVEPARRGCRGASHRQTLVS